MIQTPMRKTPRENVTRTLLRWIETGQLSAGGLVPTELDLADQCQVSRGTARSALEDLESRGILEKRSRKRFVAERQSLSPGFAQTVALIGVTVAEPGPFKDTGYLAAVHAGALEYLTKEGLNALSVHVDNVNPVDAQALLKMIPGAAIFLEEGLRVPYGKELAQAFWQANVTTVVPADGDDYQDFDRALPDFKSATTELVQRLAERGCRRILTLCRETEEYWQKEKLAGYRKGMQQLGLTPLISTPIPRKLIVAEHKSQQVFDRLARVFAGYLAEFMTREPIDAILAPTDWDVSPIAEACRILGVDPDRTITFTGYDNKYHSSPWTAFESTIPALTVDKQMSTVGTRLAQLARTGRRQSDGSPARKIVVPSKIMETA